jgi:hypothetical protein
VGLGFGLAGAGTSLYDVYLHGWNKCNGVSFGMSLLSVAFSVGGIAKGLSSSPVDPMGQGSGNSTERPTTQLYRPIGGGSGQDVIMELGVGRGKNLVNLGRLFPWKAIMGVDVDTELAAALIRKEGLDNISLMRSAWDNVRPSSANEVISIAPGGSSTEDILALGGAVKAVEPGGRIYIGSQTTTFANELLPSKILSVLDVLTNRGLSYTLEYTGTTGSPTGFDSWGYPLVTDYGLPYSYLIVRVNP